MVKIGLRQRARSSMFRPPMVSADFAHIDFWVFDLDNTLYPPSSGLFAQIDARMRAFVSARFGVDDEGARAIQKGYYRSHGTTLNGLMTEHGVDPHEFMGFVHDIDLSGLARDDALADAICALPGRKAVFTNGSAAHATRVMGQLGVTHAFDGIADIFSSNFSPKPKLEAYHALFARFGGEPKRSVLFEDLPRNLQPAHEIGMTTVLVSAGEHPWQHDGPPAPSDHSPFVHHETDDLAAFLRRLKLEDAA